MPFISFSLFQLEFYVNDPHSFLDESFSTSSLSSSDWISSQFLPISWNTNSRQEYTLQLETELTSFMMTCRSGPPGDGHMWAGLLSQMTPTPPPGIIDPPTWGGHHGLVVGMYDCGGSSNLPCARALWLPPIGPWLGNQRPWYVQPNLSIEKKVGILSQW